MKQLYIVWMIMSSLINISIIILCIIGEAFVRYGLSVIISIIPQYLLLYVGLKELDNKDFLVLYVMSILPVAMIFLVMKLLG